MVAKAFKPALLIRSWQAWLVVIRAILIIVVTGLILDNFEGKTTAFQSVIFLIIIGLTTVFSARILSRIAGIR